MILTCADSATRTWDVSAEGKALHKFPPTVATFRMATEPSWLAACERIGYFL